MSSAWIVLVDVDTKQELCRQTVGCVPRAGDIMLIKKTASSHLTPYQVQHPIKWVQVGENQFSVQLDVKDVSLKDGVQVLDWTFEIPR